MKLRAFAMIAAAAALCFAAPTLTACNTIGAHGQPTVAGATQDMRDAETGFRVLALTFGPDSQRVGQAYRGLKLLRTAYLVRMAGAPIDPDLQALQAGNDALMAPAAP